MRRFEFLEDGFDFRRDGNVDGGAGLALAGADYLAHAAVGFALVVVACAMGELAGLDAGFAVGEELVEIPGAGAVGSVGVVVVGGLALGVGEVGTEALPLAGSVRVIERAVLGIEPGVLFMVEPQRIACAFSSHGHRLHFQVQDVSHAAPSILHPCEWAFVLFDHQIGWLAVFVQVHLECCGARRLLRFHEH